MGGTPRHGEDHAVGKNDSIPGLRKTLLVEFGDGTTALSVGLQARHRLHVACTIEDWTILGDVSGSIEIDIWKSDLAGYPPDVSDTITGGAPPVMTAATSASGDNTGWSARLDAGDCLIFNIDSVTSLQQATLALSIAPL